MKDKAPNPVFRIATKLAQHMPALGRAFWMDCEARHVGIVWPEGRSENNSRPKNAKEAMPGRGANFPLNMNRSFRGHYPHNIPVKLVHWRGPRELSGKWAV
jgi:hypothetical protein